MANLMEYGDWDVLMKRENVMINPKFLGCTIQTDTSPFRPQISIKLSRHSVLAQNIFRDP